MESFREVLTPSAGSERKGRLMVATDGLRMCVTRQLTEEAVPAV